MIKVFLSLSLLLSILLAYSDIKDWIEQVFVKRQISKLLKAKATQLAKDANMLILTLEKFNTVIIATVCTETCALTVENKLFFKGYDCSEYRNELVQKAKSLYEQGNYLDMEEEVV